ncbi:hypothetical protein [Dactylosporangium sp. NPDC005555]|uniref:hypothetical protein n=1 Tax=Dactylosporangium sp. NPDC005555 TaxID=3154889 RepID=UPI0033AA483C
MTTLTGRLSGYPAAGLLWLGAAGALVAAATMARHVGFDAMRQRAEVMVAVVAVLVLVAAIPVGPAAPHDSGATVVRAAVGCVVAFEVLAVAQALRADPPITHDGGPRTGDAATVLAVWAALLGLVLLATVRATGRRTGNLPGVATAATCGFAGGAAWLAAAALLPGVAAGNVPALLAMIAVAGVAAHRIGRRGGTTSGTATGTATVVAAAVAAMVTATVVAAAIDGLLPLGHAWVRNSAPPWASGVRLVDPAGLLVIAGVLALVVLLGAGQYTSGRLRKGQAGRRVTPAG